MSGTINLALTQQFDTQGDPLSGGLLSFFAAGSTTPQNVFQDTGLTIQHPNPIVLDASGRVPMFYVSDGFIKIRLTDKNGVVIIAADQLLVIGPSSGGGGGGGASDVTQLMTTGDIKARYDTSVKDGFVRLNGNTIGNVGSSATERQESVCQPLFEYLWTWPNIALEGFAKGTSALADWGAGRRMILPDLRGRTIAGMDDMGAAAALRLTVPFFGAAATVLGNVGGVQSMPASALPTHTHALLSNNNGGGLLVMGAESADHTHSWGGTFGTAGANSSLDHTHNYFDQKFVPGATAIGQPGGAQGGSSGQDFRTSEANNSGLDHTHNVSVGGNTGGRSAVHNHNVNGSTQNFGSGASGGAGAASIVPPAMVMTWYMKL